MEFSIATQSFATNVAKVKKLVRWENGMVTRLDLCPNGVLGTIQFMNQAILLVDLRQVLGVEAPAQNLERQLVLIAEFNRKITAFLIDAVHKIHRVSWSQLQPTEQVISTTSSYTTSSLQLEERVIMVLDLEHIMVEISPMNSILHSDDRIAALKPNERRSEIKIVFAEDSPMIRRATIDQLKKAGFVKILPFGNGKQAWEYFKVEMEKAKKEGRPVEEIADLLLTDIEMPEMDGLTLCKTIRSDLELKKLPILVYSSLINDQMAVKCKSVGATAWMTKPEIDKIVEIIDESIAIAAKG